MGKVQDLWAWAFNLLVVAAHAYAMEGSPPSEFIRTIDGMQFNRTGPVSATELHALRNEARFMFQHGFQNYMQKAFPKDDLRPISCRGSNSQGGMALTLVDALDTLLLLGEQHEVRRAVQWLSLNLSFEVDERVHVFELTIRALGGLLSTHVLLLRDSTIVPQYDGSLLRLAQELGDRLLPAFHTPTRIPLSWVNLARGVIQGDTRATCTACAGTLLLEFGLLTHLSGNPTYEEHAHAAVVRLYDMRSRRTGLLGNTLNVDHGMWVRRDSGIGAGIDSFYEYLLKSWLVFGNKEYLDMFVEVYSSAMVHLQVPNVYQNSWLIDAHMDTGRMTRPWISSLGAFWPGMQAMIGQVADAERLHGNLTAAWQRFGWLPELFDLGITNRHPMEKGYPLRPELIESTYLLHVETGDPRYLEIARDLQTTLMERNQQKCGFASVRDVSTGELEDSMESFFLSETSKYLFLMHSNASGITDHFVFSTEGHLIPPMTPKDDASAPTPPPKEIPAQCQALCTPPSQADRAASLQKVREAFPLIKVDDSMDLLRPRRCLACTEVVAALKGKSGASAELRKRLHEDESCVAEHEENILKGGGVAKHGGTCDASRDQRTKIEGMQAQDWLGGPGTLRNNVQVIQQVACSLEWNSKGELHCQGAHTLLLESEQDIEALPENIVVLQLTAVQMDTPIITVQYLRKGSLVFTKWQAMGSSFGPEMIHLWQLTEEEWLSEQGPTGISDLTQGRIDDAAALRAQKLAAGQLPRTSTLLDGQAVKRRKVARVSGFLTSVEPEDGCQITEDLSKAIVLLNRGGCTFLQKIQQAEFIVVNTLEEGQLLTMGDDGSGTQPGIPAVSVTSQSGAEIRNTLAADGRDILVGKAPRHVIFVALETMPDEEANQVYVTGSSQINMLITPRTQTWLFKQADLWGVDLNKALQAVLDDSEALAALMDESPDGPLVSGEAGSGGAEDEEDEYYDPDYEEGRQGGGGGEKDEL